MKYLRIIPKLDIKGKNLVKGIHLEGLRVLGEPYKFAEYYANNGADEIIYNDVVASLYGRNSLLELISHTAKNCSIPITVGGGIRTIEDIKNILKAGADKVSINTAAINNLEFVRQAVKTFGSSTIVITVEASFYNNEYMVFTNCGREYSGLEVENWVLEIANEGVGEILLTSIDHEGTGNGFDNQLIEKIYDKIEIPLIVHGGGKKPDDLIKIKKKYKIDSFAISSMIHYNFIKENNFDEKNYSIGNTSFLKSKKNFKQFGNYSIEKIKKELSENNIKTRNQW